MEKMKMKVDVANEVICKKCPYIEIEPIQIYANDTVYETIIKCENVERCIYLLNEYNRLTQSSIEE